MAYRNYGVANSYIVNPNGQGDYLTVTAALAAAVSGNVIYLFPATYAESFTVPAGVTITSLPGSETIGSVIIHGTITFTSAGSYSLSSLELLATSGSVISCTGSNACNIYVNNCNIISNGANSINFTNSSSSSNMMFRDCTGDISSSGHTLFTSTSAGNLRFYNSKFTNSGASTTASTASAGSLSTNYCIFNIPITSSGTSTYGIGETEIDTSAINQPSLTIGGSGGGFCNYGFLSSGTSAALSVKNATFFINTLNISSSNTNAITGDNTGTINYGCINFVGSSSSVANVALQFSVTRLGNVYFSPLTTAEFSSTSTLQIDSGAKIDVQSGAILQVDTGASVDLPLSGLLVGKAAGNPIVSLPLTTNGQIPIGGASGPVASTITAGFGLSVVNGNGSITLSTTGNGFPWTDVTTTTQALAVNNGYVTDNASNVTYTLPSTASFGDVIMIEGKIGLTTITPNANQQILIGSLSGTVGVTGTAVGTNVGDCTTLRCITGGSSTVWRFSNFVGNWSLT